MPSTTSAEQDDALLAAVKYCMNLHACCQAADLEARLVQAAAGHAVIKPGAADPAHQALQRAAM